MKYKGSKLLNPCISIVTIQRSPPITTFKMGGAKQTCRKRVSGGMPRSQLNTRSTSSSTNAKANPTAAVAATTTEVVDKAVDKAMQPPPVKRIKVSEPVMPKLSDAGMVGWKAFQSWALREMSAHAWRAEKWAHAYADLAVRIESQGVEAKNNDNKTTLSMYSLDLPECPPPTLTDEQKDAVRDSLAWMEAVVDYRENHRRGSQAADDNLWDPMHSLYRTATGRPPYYTAPSASDNKDDDDV